VKRSWLAGVLVVMGIATPVWAAEAAVPAELLLFTQEELTVTATRRAKPVTEAPSATTVITREEIHRSGIWHVPDLLRRVVGVDVAQTTAGHSEVNIRGLNKPLSPRTLVLVDGRTVYINGQGFIPWEAIPLQVEDIDRIEIVKGPVQALYGSPALSGVINIITRSPFDMKGVELYQRFGNRFLHEDLIQGAQLSDTVGYKMGFGWKEWDAFKDVDKDAVDEATWTGAVSKKLGDMGQATLSSGFSRGEFDILTSDGTGSGPMKNRTEFIKANTEIGDFHAQYFWNRYQFNVLSVNLDEDLTINTHDLDLSYQHAVGPHTLLGGVGARYEQMDSNIFNPDGTKTETMWDLFLQDEWQLLEPLTWYGTIRLDRHPVSKYNIAYRTSLVFEPIENQVLWATIGRTFRNPTFSESKIDLTFPTIVNSFASSRPIGNEALNAENMESYEVGYRSLWAKRVKLEASLFNSRFDDIIQGVAGTPGLITEAPFQNQGRIYTTGAELSTEIFVCPWLTTFASYTFQDLEREDGAPEDDLSPPHKATLGFDSTYKKFSGELFMQYVDHTEASSARQGQSNPEGKVAPYWWTSLRLGYAVNENAELALTVINLFHDVHREEAAASELGSRIIVEANLKF